METEEQEVSLCGKIEPSPIGKGSKRTRNPDKWAKNVKKQKLYSSKSLPRKPNCNHKAAIFKCDTLGMQDVRKFHQGFYSVKDKSYQDNFILKNSDSEKPKRERAREERKQENEVWNRYYIPVATGGRVQICKKAFCSILGLNQKRVQRVCKRHFVSGELSTEKRGGDHRSSKMENCKEAIRQFIENLVPMESHYCRNTKKIRQYLTSDVTITKLWKSYNDSFDSDELKVDYEFFRNIFNTEYNIGFGSPATDVCSKCIQLKELAKTNKIHEVEYKVHKARASTFFKLLQHREDNEIVFSFDCQKNLVLPKLPDQATYYSRQLYLYNFTICLGTSKDKQDKESVFMYTWTEADYQKGSNQIASAVYHRLCNTNLDGYSHVRLFADGCGGQNKNSIITFMLSYWLCNCAPHNIESVHLIFPVPGHSFMPPDRVFGRVEKELRRFDTIIKPEEYWTIFENHGTVIKVRDNNIDMFDWKESSCLNQKPLKDWHFKFSPCKRFIITRGRTPSAPVLVKGEVAYSTDCGSSKKVIKPGVNIRSLQVAKINPGNELKPAKVADVKRLLTLHFGDEWKTHPDLKYYSTLFDREIQVNIEPEDEEEGGHMEEVEGIV